MTKTIYVRPGARLTLKRKCHTVFGHGVGAVRLSLSAGAVAGPQKDGGCNGFVAWQECDVTLSSGEWARVEEWHSPGGQQDTMYVADRALWKAQRRASWATRLRARAAERAWYERQSLRRDAIMSALHQALTEYDQCVFARRGRATRDRRKWAQALAATYCVEIIRGCNLGYCDDGLDSRRVRWEFEPGELLQGNPPPEVQRALEL